MVRDQTDKRSNVCPISADAGVVVGQTVAFTDRPAYRVYRCSRCGHKWVARPQGDIGETAIRVESRPPSTNAEWILSRLPPLTREKRGTRVLDVGCWDGTILAGLPSNWNRVGVELNPAAAEIARSHGIRVLGESFETARLEPSSFDLVLMMDVLEHVEDPQEVLSKAARLLDQDGYLVALTGNADSVAARILGGKWYYLNYREHVTCFSERSVRLALTQANLSLEHISTVSHPTNSVGRVFKRSWSAVKTTGTPLDGDLAHGLGWRDSLLLALSRAVRNRDHLFVIARKAGASCAFAG